MKRVPFLILVALVFLASSKDALAGRRSHYYGGASYRTGHIHKAPTYEIGGTKYKMGETYKTTGQPKVERSGSAKREFLKSRGYSKEPNGYEVDHIVPLSKGGADRPYNMQLLSKEAHKRKTAGERMRR